MYVIVYIYIDIYIYIYIYIYTIHYNTTTRFRTLSMQGCSKLLLLNIKYFIINLNLQEKVISIQ